MVRVKFKCGTLAVLVATVLGQATASGQTAEWSVTLPPASSVEFRMVVRAGASFTASADFERLQHGTFDVADEYGVVLTAPDTIDIVQSVSLSAIGRSRTLRLRVFNARSLEANRVVLRAIGSDGPSAGERALVAARLEPQVREARQREAERAAREADRLAREDYLMRELEKGGKALAEELRAAIDARDRERGSASEARRAELERAIEARREAIARADEEMARYKQVDAKVDGPPLASWVKPEPTAQGYAVIPVYFATDRARAEGPELTYGKRRSPNGAVALGRIDVSVPRDTRHRVGNIERPNLWTLYQEDPDQHFVVVFRRQQTGNEFFSDLRSKVTASSRRELFVFVHGFNVGFDDAVFRTAQIAYDLGFDGAPVLYSWPSEESVSPVGYATDLANNDWTVSHLATFLNDLVSRSSAARIHIIAHSMGNRALVNALNRLSPTRVARFAQVLLTAPDIDADTFVQLADAVRQNSQRTTLYASANDLALAASRRLQTHPRAGDASREVVVVPDIDTVDVSALDTNLIGHSYYGDNASVISDMTLVLSHGLPPAERPRIRVTGVPPKRFWRFLR